MCGLGDWFDVRSDVWPSWTGNRGILLDGCRHSRIHTQYAVHTENISLFTCLVATKSGWLQDFECIFGPPVLRRTTHAARSTQPMQGRCKITKQLQSCNELYLFLGQLQTYMLLRTITRSPSIGPMVPAVSWYRRSRLFQEIYFCVCLTIHLHTLLQDSTTLSTFFFFFFSFSAAFWFYHSCVLWSGEKKKKKKPTQENIQCCEPKSRKRAGIRE